MASGIPPVGALARSILAGGREIVSEQDPLQVEVWASTMLGTFYKPPVPFEVAEELTRELWPAVVRAATVQGDRRAVAVLRALAAVADDGLRPLMDEAADSLNAAGVSDPPWTAAIGHPEFLECWTASDPFGDQCGFYLHFRYPGRGQHLVIALYDTNLGGIIKDASVGELRTGADPRAKGAAGPDIIVRDGEPSVVAGRITQGLATGDMFIDNDWTADFRDTRALLTARLRCLPAAAPPGPPPESLDDDERAALVDEFLDSPEASRDPAARSIVMHCLDARCDFGDGDPLRWSPVVVELFLLDYLPRKAMLEPDEIEAVPAVLTAWVRFALGKRGLAEHLIRETEEAVRTFAAEYREAVVDPANFDLGKAMYSAMRADGIDIADERAVEAWIDAWNERRRNERGETPDSTSPQP